MRVRFAPSPTGALHIGGARTALYNWLLARGNEGELALRIEDTDRERSTPENVEQIFDALRWLGIDWDGEPVFQSRRAERHAEVVEKLLSDGHAYRSTAGPENVRAYKEANGNRGFRGEDEGTGAVRLRVPDEGHTTVVDVVRGETQFENALQDDLVIARGDSTPVYHLAVVVDDHDAGITHVVRGADHYSNTPKHVLIQRAMGAGTPVYAHLPLLHGPDGKTTFLTTEELQSSFSLEKVSKSPAVFDEQKLRWMNGRYLRDLDVDDLTARLEERTGRTGLRDAVAISQEKISTLDEFWPLARALVDEPADDAAAREKFIAPELGAEALDVARSALADVPEPWTTEAVEEALRQAVGRSGLKAKQLFQPLRVALTGTTISPGIFETVALIGREKALARIDGALDGRRGA